VVLEGTIEWIDSRVDPQTRTVCARAVVPNHGGMLKDGMIAEVKLEGGAAFESLHVPAGAVQEYEGDPYVFVKLDQDLYELRRVALGARENGRVAVKEGLAPEENIVLARSFTVKSEFLKSRLGAGCTDH
jgi:cobalt-zinc-cadmium efflux system membrane fusion protein